MQPLATLASKALSPSSETPQQTLEKAQYLEAARMLLGCYRAGDANDPEVYISAVVRVLSGYPLDVVMRVIDPLTGLPSKLKWLPTVPEILSACEEIHGLQRRIKESDELTRKQLAERGEWDRVRASNEHETTDELWADMERRGWTPTGDRKQVTYETVATIKKKYGLTDEQWDAIPDQPESSLYWRGVR